MHSSLREAVSDFAWRAETHRESSTIDVDWSLALNGRSKFVAVTAATESRQMLM
jgi:hypothetical protein